MRLRGGNYSNEGCVEVYWNGQWGTICDDGFSSTNVQTNCKQLRYNYYHRYDHLSCKCYKSKKVSTKIV